MIFLREAGHHALPTWFPTRLPPNNDSSRTNSFVRPAACAPSSLLHNRDTEKIVCLLLEMTHNDIFKRGWASCSAIPTIPPPEGLSMNQFAGTPSSRNSDILAPGASKKKGLGGKKAFSCHTERKKMTQQSTIQSGGFFIISAAFLRAPNRRWGRQDKMIDEVTSPRAIGTGWEERHTNKNLIIELLFFAECRCWCLKRSDSRV